MKEEKKHLLLPPLPLKSKKKSRRTPSFRTMNKYNKIISLAPLNSKKQFMKVTSSKK